MPEGQHPHIPLDTPPEFDRCPKGQQLQNLYINPAWLFFPNGLIEVGDGGGRGTWVGIPVNGL